MFLDGVANEFDDFKRLGELKLRLPTFSMLTRIGFVEWARYKDVWKDTR